MQHKNILFLVLLWTIALCAAPLKGQVPISRMQPVMNYTHVSVLSSPTDGWAVVTNDAERTVLAYGEQPIDPSDVSPEFRWIVEQYDQNYNLDSAQRTRRQISRSRVAPQNVATLVTSRWGQGYPFNDACPKDQVTGYQSKTGCVATATAQVLYYHRRKGEANSKQYISKLIGLKRYTYTDSKKNHITVSLNLANVTLDWANLCDTYVSNTAAERQAVAQLMYVCGVAANMIYGSSVSLSDPGVCAAGLTASFQGIQARMANFDEDLIRTEIIAGRPVIYSGNDGRGNAHAFILDGMTDDGKIHCNMGYNGAGDGYYSISNLGNYPNPQNLMLISTTDDDKPSITPVIGLNANDYAQASTTAATNIETDKWYILWNAGRGGAPMSQGIGSTIYNASIMPGNEQVRYTAAQMVRFVARPAGGYYIQTGRGDYLGNFSAQQGATATTSSSQSAWFGVEEIASGYFALKSMGTRYIDTNGPGGTVVGWNTDKPTDCYSNSSWQIFPVTTQATEFSHGGGGGGVVSDNPFDGKKYFTIKNTGYSQGYLVALNSTDANPVLRGVTTLHANNNGTDTYGYREAFDPYNRGSYWTLEATTPATSTTSGIIYIKNVLTGKYLAAETNTDQQPYIFKDRSSVTYNKRADGTYWFKSSGTNDNSYLCAATHLSNPAAFWTINDDGSIWTVEEVPSIPLRTTDGSQFSATSRYTIRNASGCGYLVATSSTDAAPTLRGVTRGGEVKEAYREEADMTEMGTFWNITHDEDGIYVQNCLTNSYLTNEGDRTTYRLSAIRVPLRMGLHEGSDTYWMTSSSSLDSESFACAAPASEAALAFGTYDCSEAKWTITASEPIAKVLPTSITLNKSQVVLLAGTSSQLTATIAPGTATHKSIVWSSSNSSVAEVSASGLVTAVGEGTVEIIATSKAAPTVTATCVVAVVSSMATNDITSKSDANWASGNQYQIYNAATGKYLVAEKVSVSSGTAYGVSFDKNAAHTYNKDGNTRQITKLCLAGQEITVTNPNLTYQDLTSQTFRINPGESVKPAIVWNGSWMAAYVYVDTNASDKQFTTSELVASTAGEGSHDFTADIPAFSISTPGRYRMRYKVDWNNTDPQGSSSIITNGGYVIDVTLIVGDPEDLPEVDYTWRLTTSTTAELSDESTFWELTCTDKANGPFTLRNVAADMCLMEETQYGAYSLGSASGNLSILAGQLTGLQIRDKSNSYITATNLTGVSTQTTNDFWVFKKIAGVSFETHITDAQILMANTFLSNAGKVGYPAADDAATLALSTLVNQSNATSTVTTSEYRTRLAAYLSAPAVMPESGKAYYVSAVHVNSQGTVTDRAYLYTDAEGRIYASPTAKTDQPTNRFVVRRTYDGQYLMVNEQSRYLCWFASGDAGYSHDEKGTSETFSSLYNTMRIVPAITPIDRTTTNGYVSSEQKFGHFQIWGNAGSAQAENEDRRFLTYNAALDPSHAFVNRGNSTLSYSQEGDTYLFDLEEVTTYTYTTPKLNKVNPADTEAYGTVYLPFAMDIPEGVQAYAATEEYDREGTCYLNLVKVAEGGDALPAGAYILYSEEVSGPISVLPSTREAADLEVENKLFGSTSSSATLPASGINYVLSGKSGIGFYKYTGAAYPLGKAIYNIDETHAPVAAFYFNFDHTVTNCPMTPHQNAAPVAYDLWGRRVEGGARGVILRQKEAGIQKHFVPLQP